MNPLQRTLYRQIYRSLVQIQRDYLSQGISIERAVASGIVRHDKNSQAVITFEADILQQLQLTGGCSTRSLRAAVSARFRNPCGALQEGFNWIRDGSDLYQAIGKLSTSHAYTPQERFGARNSGPLYGVGEVVHHCVHGPMLIYGWDNVAVATESIPNTGLVDNRHNFVGMDPQPHDGSSMPFYRGLSPDGFARYVREDNLVGYTEEDDRVMLPTPLPPFQGSSFFFRTVYLQKVLLDAPASAEISKQFDHNHTETPFSAPSVDVPVYIPTGALHKQYPHDIQYISSKFNTLRSKLRRHQHQHDDGSPLAQEGKAAGCGRSPEQILGASLGHGDEAMAAELAQELTNLKAARNSWISKQELEARPPSSTLLPDMQYLTEKNPGSHRPLFKIDDEW